MGNQAILTFNNISKNYGDLLALDNVSFDIPQNSIYGILGPNGSGKSTLMRILANLILDYSGSIIFENEEINSNSKKAISSFGFLIENPSFYEFLSAKQNLEILSKISNVTQDKIEEVLYLVNLFNRRDDKVQAYSYGMKQRLGLAQTLLHDPKILVLDEPNNGLDPKGINDMSKIIKNLQSEGKTIILSTHILSEVESLCSHFSILKHGKKIATESMEKLLEKSNHYSIEVSDIELAKEELAKSEKINIVSINQNQISLISTEKLDIDALKKILADKAIIQQFYKNSGLIELFND
tara:strand:- start:4034 stop:4921 length:888 start_codon:yes stop_codon:yes gene_type:complete